MPPVWRWTGADFQVSRAMIHQTEISANSVHERAQSSEMNSYFVRGENVHAPDVIAQFFGPNHATNELSDVQADTHIQVQNLQLVAHEADVANQAPSEGEHLRAPYTKRK